VLGRREVVDQGNYAVLSNLHLLAEVSWSLQHYSQVSSIALQHPYVMAAGLVSHSLVSCQDQVDIVPICSDLCFCKLTLLPSIERAQVLDLFGEEVSDVVI
jgi:hypothetical protein